MIIHTAAATGSDVTTSYDASTLDCEESSSCRRMGAGGDTGPCCNAKSTQGLVQRFLLLLI